MWPVSLKENISCDVTDDLLFSLLIYVIYANAIKHIYTVHK